MRYDPSCEYGFELPGQRFIRLADDDGLLFATWALIDPREPHRAAELTLVDAVKMVSPSERNQLVRLARACRDECHPEPCPAADGLAEAEALLVGELEIS